MIELEKAIKELGNVYPSDTKKIKIAFQKVKKEFFMLKNADRSEVIRYEPAQTEAAFNALLWYNDKPEFDPSERKFYAPALKEWEREFTRLKKIAIDLIPTSAKVSPDDAILYKPQTVKTEGMEALAMGNELKEDSPRELKPIEDLHPYLGSKLSNKLNEIIERINILSK